ncbi:TIM44-like domain-containing protein [Silvimonas sp. JCM 19000]
MLNRLTGSRLFLATLILALTLGAQAEAARLGGGRSAGMQRGQISRQAPPPQREAPQAPPAQRGNAGVGTALAGAAVGAAAGYALARSGNNHASGAAESSGGVPWGWLLLLGLLTFAGFMFLRRRERPIVNAYPETRPVPGWNDPTKLNTQGQKVYRIGENAMSNGQQAPQKLPEGTDTAAFLRHAKASFQHLQALNSPDQLEELRKYLTPELFTALHDEIDANRDIADFPSLDIDLLDVAEQPGQVVASVRFKGLVSERVNAPAIPFEEVWHFTKQPAPGARWLLAGIEQPV